MGLGNGNAKSGNKGSNFNYELRVLQLLEQVRAATAAGGGGDATEAKQDSMIALLTDIEAFLTTLVNQPCAISNLSNVNTTFGAGKRAFSINLTAGSAVIGGEAVVAPFVVDFAESGTNNTLAGITIDTTGDPDAVCIGATVG